MIKEDRLTERFLELVKISSPSLHERKVGDCILKILREIGLEATEDGAGVAVGGDCGNITVFLRGNGKRTVLFSAHMDTVGPCEKINPVVTDGVVHTDGTSVLGGDDKSGIVVLLEAAQAVLENDLDRPDVVLTFSIGEEIGLLGAKNFAIEQYKPDFIYVLDTGGKPGTAVTKAPNSANGWLKVIGKAAHAGRPEGGINALYVASHAIAGMKLGRVDEETTANIGIVNGGQAGNIVMPDVRMKYEARSFSPLKLETLLKETKELFEKTAAEYGAKFEYDVRISYQGFDWPEGSEILQPVKTACENIGLPHTVLSGGGGSDANIYNHKGFPAINLSTGMDKVHTVDESIAIADMIDAARLIVELIGVLAR